MGSPRGETALKLTRLRGGADAALRRLMAARDAQEHYRWNRPGRHDQCQGRGNRCDVCLAKL